MRDIEQVIDDLVEQIEEAAKQFGLSEGEIADRVVNEVQARAEA